MNAVKMGKKSFGEARFSRICHARYLAWQDAFEVEFNDGLCFLEDHESIRKANNIAKKALPVRVVLDKELGSHFRVEYDDGTEAVISWSFIRESSSCDKKTKTPILSAV